jgi:multidrug efflux pump subunit AcrA (membrane-fusion protein)
MNAALCASGDGAKAAYEVAPVPPADAAGHAETLPEAAARRLAALSELLARVQMSATPAEACQILADLLHDHLGCQQVVVGLCRPGTTDCRVQAISHVDAFHPDGEDVRAAQTALQEAIARNGISIWPAPDDTGRFALRGIRRYARLHSWEMVVGSPLQDERGGIRGAWLMAGPAKGKFPDEARAWIPAAQSSVASTLQLVQRAEVGPVRRWLNGFGQSIGRWRGAALAALLLACVALMWMPVPRRVACDCQLEPVTRRFVAAPFAAPLERTFVQPGDIVTQGQLLARLDGREIRWELAGVQADLFRAAKQRAGHVASHEAGEAEIARHEVDRLQSREQLLRARDQDLEIRSSVDGMVVSGDLQDVEGMPLKVGEVLFEVAPLNAMIVELAIPEEDLPEVRAGMPVRIRLDAFPLQIREAVVERIHPRAEVVEDQNVFIAEVRLENPRHTLRPGMRGHARIAAGYAPLGWILFRRPWFAALQWLGW